MLKSLENACAYVTVYHPRFLMPALRLQMWLHRVFPHTKPAPHEIPTPPGCYRIMINETQRLRILDALRRLDLASPPDADDDDVLFLEPMFDHIDHPAHDRESLHDFTA